jgi:hypothetical protein
MCLSLQTLPRMGAQENYRGLRRPYATKHPRICTSHRDSKAPVGIHRHSGCEHPNIDLVTIYPDYDRFVAGAGLRHEVVVAIYAWKRVLDKKTQVRFVHIDKHFTLCVIRFVGPRIIFCNPTLRNEG